MCIEVGEALQEHIESAALTEDSLKTCCGEENRR